MFIGNNISRSHRITTNVLIILHTEHQDAVLLTVEFTAPAPKPTPVVYLTPAPTPAGPPPPPLDTFEIELVPHTLHGVNDKSAFQWTLQASEPIDFPTVSLARLEIPLDRAADVPTVRNEPREFVGDDFVCNERLSLCQ
jgi:hypothetical protein